MLELFDFKMNLETNYTNFKAFQGIPNFFKGKTRHKAVKQNAKNPAMKYLRPILTVTPVLNTGETGNIDLPLKKV